MHTRKRVLAGVTAGSLALGVLALSPVSPASAVIEGGTTPTGAYAYLTGSLVQINVPLALDSQTCTSQGQNACNGQGNSAVKDLVAARITTDATVGAYGEFRSGATPTYNGGVKWDDVTTAGASIRVNQVNGNTGQGQNQTQARDFIAIKANVKATVTVQIWVDTDLDGVIDQTETAQPVQTLKFVEAADVTVVATTVPGGAVQVNAAGGVAFSPTVLVGTDALLQSDAGPIGGVSGRAAPWTQGAFASLNGAPATATSPIAAAATGIITVTAWFDPTGTVTGTPTAAPLTPPTGFKAAQATVAVVDQNFVNAASTMTASGTGLVANGTFYAAPLTTTAVTFEATVLRTDPLTGLPTPFANVPVTVSFTKRNGGAVPHIVDGLVSPGSVNRTTDASGKVTVAMTLTNGTNPLLPNNLEIDAKVTAAAGVSGLTIPTTTVKWQSPGVVSVAKSSGSINGLPFLPTAPLTFYSSVASNTVSSMTVNLVDTFGNPMPATLVEVYQLTNPQTFGLTALGQATTGPTGTASLGFAGQADRSKTVLVSVGGQPALTVIQNAPFPGPGTLVASGTVLYKPAAQLQAGGIAAPARQREDVTLDALNPELTKVTFKVVDSAGDPMNGIFATVSVSGGVGFFNIPAAVPTYEYSDGTTLTAGVVGGFSILGNPVIVENSGELSVWVASRTVGTASVTLSVGGKSATALVDFTNRDALAETLTIGPAGGGAVPKSVAAKSSTKMQVMAMDANGNPLEEGYVVVRVKGNARLASGGRQTVLFTGPNGTANFRVTAWSQGSYRVIAKTDSTEGVLQLKAKTGEIKIKPA